MQKLDPILIEIIQNRLMQIGREAGISMIRAAASLVVVGSKDLGFNIADHLGRTVVYSTWMPRHGTTLRFMLQSCVARFKDKGINPDDMFMVNNPHDGALHVLDIAILAPVHYRGEIVAWAGCATHHIDVRAMRPGFTPDASDWFQEGIIFRPIKIIENGKLREDIFNFLMDNVRVPRLQGLDLKAQIAACNVAKDKLLRLVERYGPETLKAAYDEIIDFAEAKTRERIRTLTPGKYETVEYLDYVKLYKLKCTLTVDDDTLTFDFTGTDPQSNTYINSAAACTIANVHNIITCMLIPDVIANEGCFRPIRMVLPERTVLSCLPPAPCSGASVIGGWKAQSLALTVLSQAFSRSPRADKAIAGWGYGWLGLSAAGADQYGKPYATSFMSASLQGGGARATKDGFDCCNNAGSTNSSVPNVEDTECRFPFLYLKRGMVTDSGGAGKYRGGLAGEVEVKVHDTSRAEFYLGYIGKETAAQGYQGGRNGMCSEVAARRGTSIESVLKKTVPDFDEIDGQKEVLPQKNAPFTLQPQDVIYMRCQGGAGFGDPRERAPERVRHDVIEGLVSVESARDDYGVVIDPDTLELDKTATGKLRRAL